MGCEYCGYCWQAADEDYPQCHFEGSDWAPCERLDYEPEDYWEG